MIIRRWGSAAVGDLHLGYLARRLSLTGAPGPPPGGGLLSRRQALAALAVLGGGGLLAADGGPLAPRAVTEPGSVGYAPDGAAGQATAFPLSAVRLLDGPFARNRARNTAYLLFLDPDRMLHTARLNYGQPSAAQPCGGWEAPDSEVRG